MTRILYNKGHIKDKPTANIILNSKKLKYLLKSVTPKRQKIKIKIKK